MDKDKILDDIFSNDPLCLLNVTAKKSNVRTSDERLASSFDEINDFIDKNGKEPEPNSANISEYKLYSRLKSLREDEDKKMALEPQDKHGLLKVKKKEIDTIDDIFDDDSFGIFDDDAGLFDFKHTPKPDERAKADFVARRRPCKEFDKYENDFKSVQADLATGKRKLLPFKQDNLRPGDYYVHNGVLLYLESVDFQEEVQEFNSGERVRKDGRTHCIFENGTESNMLYRSLYKVLLANGKAVSKNMDKVNEHFIEGFSDINDEDEESGYIYILKSLSKDTNIAATNNLYKIGYSRNPVPKRIQGAEKEPTYLMAPVELVTAYKCFNMNTHKFEQLIHSFFGATCLEVDVFDARGKRYTPREWFIVPLEVIVQAIHLILSGEVLKYRYDKENEVIEER